LLDHMLWSGLRNIGSIGFKFYTQTNEILKLQLVGVSNKIIIWICNGE